MPPLFTSTQVVADRKPILIVANLFPSIDRPFHGTFIKNAGDGLSKEGWNVKYVTLPSYGKGPIAYFRFYAAALHASMSHPGFVYVHYVSHSVPPVLLAKLFNRQLTLVLHYHGSDAFPESNEGTTRTFLKWFICSIANRVASKIVSPSEGFSKALQKKFHLHSGTVAISPSGGIDSEVFFNNPNSNRSIDVLFAGRLLEEKGCLIAANIISELYSKKLIKRGVILGDGPLASKVKQSALGEKQQNIQLHPPVSQADLAKYFQNARVLLFPSSRKGESLGLIWIEAIFCGAVPIFLNNQVLLDNLPQVFHTSLVASNEQALGSLARKLLQDESQRKQLSLELINHYTPLYSRTEVSKSLSSLFTEIPT